MALHSQPWKAGTVLWFNPSKGFGVIRPEDLDEDDVRFDMTAIEGRDLELMHSNTRVDYIAEQNLTGMCAVKVKIGLQC